MSLHEAERPYDVLKDPEARELAERAAEAQGTALMEERPWRRTHDRAALVTDRPDPTRILDDPADLPSVGRLAFPSGPVTIVVRIDATKLHEAMENFVREWEVLLTNPWVRELLKDLTTS